MVKCTNCGFVNKNLVNLYITKKCENCDYPLPSESSQAGLIAMLIALSCLVMIIMAPFYTYGIFAWLAVGYAVYFYFTHRNSEPTAKEEQVRIKQTFKIIKVSLITMWVSATVAFGTMVFTNSSSSSSSGRENAWPEVLLLGLTAWDKLRDHRDYIPLGLLCFSIWVSVTIFVYKKFLSDESIALEIENEKQEKQQRAVIEAEAQRQAELARSPFLWEADYPVKPEIPHFDIVENIGGITQEHINAYSASTRDFWVATHRSIQASYSAFSNHSDKSLRQFSQVCFDDTDIQTALEILNQFIVLKGEFLVGSSGPHIITNYRLQLLVDSVRYNIPLYNLKTYTLENGPLDIIWNENGQERSLSVTGTVLAEALVNGVLSARGFEVLNYNQKLLIEKNRVDLNLISPELSFSDIEKLDPNADAEIPSISDPIPETSFSSPKLYVDKSLELNESGFPTKPPVQSSLKKAFGIGLVVGFLVFLVLLLLS